MSSPEIKNRFTDTVIVPAGKYTNVREARSGNWKEHVK